MSGKMAILKDWRVVGGLLLLTLIFTATYIPFASIGFAGGGEVTSSLSYLSVDDFERYPYGQHYVDDWDIDGNFGDYTWNYTTGNEWQDWILQYKGNDISIDSVKKPGVTIESNNPYYMAEISGQYIAVDESEVSKTYDKTFGTKVYQYNLMLFGFDVTIKTKADVFHKDPVIFSYFSNYGYDFESKKVDVDLRQSFVIAPWIPVGVYNESYTIVGGFAGIMEAEIYAVQYGLVQEGAEENYNHVIENIQSVGSVPNMYLLSTDNPVSTTEFTDTSAIDQMPSAIDIELGVNLQAGAQYHVDVLGKWDSVAVRNVFVTYQVVVKVVGTLEMDLVTEGNVIEDPTEENTFYKPQVPIFSDLSDAWNELWADFGEYFASPGGLTMILMVLIGGGLVVYVIFRFRGGSK